MGSYEPVSDAAELPALPPRDEGPSPGPPPRLTEPDATAAEIDHGVAGRSATLEYERRHEKRERGIRQRWGRWSGLALALSADPQSTRAWRSGAAGEVTVGESLAKLSREDVIVLYDRAIPPSRANLDHLVVCPTGVFVVDAKRYRGEVRVRDVSGFFSAEDLRLLVGGRDHTQLATKVVRQAEVVLAALSGAPFTVQPVLCFVDAEWPLLGAATEFHSVLIEGPRSLRRRVARPGPLDLATIRRAATILAQRFPPHR
jgi:hypothetical protein